MYVYIIFIHVNINATKSETKRFSISSKANRRFPVRRVVNRIFIGEKIGFNQIKIAFLNFLTNTFTHIKSSFCDFTLFRAESIWASTDELIVW